MDSDSESKTRITLKETNCENELEYLKKQVAEEKAEAKRDLAQLHLINNQLKNESQIKEVLELKKDKLQHSLEYYKNTSEGIKKKYNELQIICTRTEMAIESTNRRLKIHQAVDKIPQLTKENENTLVKTQLLQHQLKSVQSRTSQHDEVLKEIIKELNLE